MPCSLTPTLDFGYQSLLHYITQFRQLRHRSSGSLTWRESDCQATRNSNNLVLPCQRVHLFLELELVLFLDCPSVLFRGTPCLFERLTLLVTQ